MDTFDWARLDRLRAIFLARAGGESYWTSREDLEQYDRTFGERIGWKWDAVLQELSERGWQPPGGVVVDWGCGSGVAGRRLIAAFGPESFERLCLFDRSSLATTFASDRARTTFPSLPTSRGIPDGPIDVLVVSHVASELDDAGTAALHSVIERAQSVLWVEPGTPEDSRALIAARESFRTTFQVVAPCTHQASCGMTTLGNQADWCHHFAEGPPGVRGDADWVRFANRAGFDLRSTPYSFLVLDRGASPNGAVSFTRVIGRPRRYKGFLKVLECGPRGVSEVGIQHRDHPDLVKAFDKGPAPRLLRGEVTTKGWKRVDEAR